MTTAIYCRVAYADDEKMAAQETEMLRFAKQNGYSDYVFYRDNKEPCEKRRSVFRNANGSIAFRCSVFAAVSSRQKFRGKSGSTLKRPGFIALMADIDGGKIDCVIVQDIARVCRNLAEFEKWLKAMEGNGIRLITVNDTFDSSRSFEGEQLSKTLELFHKELKKAMSQKIKMGIALSKQRKLAIQK
jgi:DNA invertase Pin-like site-specific DNA recombinase